MNDRVHHIIPTYRCNLDCAYCITRDRTNDRAVMSLEDAGLVMDNLLHWAQSRVNCTWYGGEPMLPGVDWYRAVIDYQQQLTQNTGVPFVNAIQTNLTLLNDDWLEFFVAAGFAIRTSLNFELRRLDRRGRDSFELVLCNIDRLRQRNVTVRAIAVIQTGDDPERIHGFFETQGLNYKVNPVFKVMADADEHGIDGEEYGRFLIGLYERVRLGSPVHVGTLDIMIAAVLFGNSMYTNCENAVSCITPDLNIFPCENLIEPQFLVGNHRHADATDPFSGPLYAEIRQRRVRECVGCEFVKICNGGCRNWSKCTGGSIHSPNPFCAAFRAILGTLRESFLQRSGIRRQDTSADDLECLQQQMRSALEAPSWLLPYEQAVFDHFRPITSWHYLLGAEA